MLISAWGLMLRTSFDPAPVTEELRPENLMENQPGSTDSQEKYLPGTDTIHDGRPRWLLHSVRWWQNILFLHSRNSRHARVQGQPIEARKRYLASDFIHARAFPTTIPRTLHRKDFPPTTRTDFQLEYPGLSSELQVSKIGHDLGIGNNSRGIGRQLQLQSARRGGCECVPRVSLDDEVVEAENRLDPAGTVFWWDCVQLDVIEIVRRLSRADQPGLWNICRKSVDWLQWQSGEQCV